MPRTEPKQERARRTKAKLMRVGHAVVQRDGRDSFRTSDITKEAQVADGTFFRYWSDRSDFLRELYPDSIEGLGEPALLRDEEGNPL